MDRNLIYSAIENPRLREGISIEEMESVREMYPYFTAAQILLAKLYQEKNDHRFADQLQKAAVYALDRKTLYQYITGEEGVEEQGTGEEGTGEEGTGEQGTREQGTGEEGTGEQGTREQGTGEQGTREQGTREQGTGEQGTREQGTREQGTREQGTREQGTREQGTREQGTGEQGTREQGTREQGTRELGIEEREVQVDSLPIHGQVEDEAEQEQEQEREREEIHAKDLDDMTQNILVEAIQSTIELEVEEEREQGNKEQRTGEQGTGEEEREQEREQGIREQGIEEREGRVNSLPIHGQVQDEAERELEQQQIEEPRTYAEWMMWKAAKQKGTLPKKTEEKTKPASELTPETPESLAKAAIEKTDIAGPSVTVQKMQVAGPRAHQQSLIDKFIQQQPKITPGKAAEYPIKDNLGKDSLEDDMTFVTETMAKLFAQQGKIDKARKVYRQLMVLHPEKSVYFAAQLKNLNQLKK
jgi:hypothetical protein